jgi:hypothetical protein
MVNKMEKLRFTTTSPHSTFSSAKGLVIDPPNNIGELISANIKSDTAYIHGKAEEDAGFDIPVFLDGDMGNLDLPINQQNIEMLLPDGNHVMQAVLHSSGGWEKDVYYLTYKDR